jgi:hypothetical protein
MGKIEMMLSRSRYQSLVVTVFPPSLQKLRTLTAIVPPKVKKQIRSLLALTAKIM